MKKLSILCATLAVAALSFTSCQKEESTTNQQFIASFEQTGNDKITVDDDLQMYWKEGMGNSMIIMYAPGYIQENTTSINFTYYAPTSISADGKTAVLEYYSHTWGFIDALPFPADQQGPFYGVTSAVNHFQCEINDDGSFHVGTCYQNNSIFDRKRMPMVARADNYGALQFKHLFGMLKVYLNLPQGYTVDYLTFNSTPGSYDPSYLNNCDVNWDANGDISMSNINLRITPQSGSSISTFREGNGFYFIPLCPGDWGNLVFEVGTYDENQNTHYFQKTMAQGASIHIERAGITTLTLNMSMNDMIR